MNVSDVKHQGRIKQLESQVKQLQDKIQDSKVKIDVENAHLRQANSALNKQLKKHLLREKQEQEYVSQVVAAITELEPLPAVTFKDAKKSKTPMTAVLHLTDWHIGERISASETESWGNFNWEIAQDRVLGQLVVNFKRWLDTQRAGYVINDIAMICTGDFVSGDIHEELRATNEFPLPVQTAKAGDLLAAVAKELAPHCETLRIIEVGADNHSRLVRKPQAKQKALNSMGYLVYHIVNQALSKHSNVKVETGDNMKLRFKIGGFTFLGEHGDSVKSWQGIPFYGMEREVAREAKRRMNTDRGFDYMMMGHWHVPNFAPYSPLIIGGSLTGTSEYDHSCGRSAPPVQTSFLVGKRGAFGFVPFTLR